MSELCEARFWTYVHKSDGCWSWTGALNQGYGCFRWKGRMRSAHRISYELAQGPIPRGLQLDHLCRNRACVRPDHLDPVTSHENSHRSPLTQATINSGKTGCKNGHPLEGENVFVTKDGRRNCRACRQRSQRDSYWRRGKARRKELRDASV